jgi:hypothetical protein
LHFVDTMDEVLKVALERQPVALPLPAPSVEMVARSNEDLTH